MWIQAAFVALSTLLSVSYAFPAENNEAKHTRFIEVKGDYLCHYASLYNSLQGYNVSYILEAAMPVAKPRKGVHIESETEYSETINLWENKVSTPLYSTKTRDLVPRTVFVNFTTLFADNYRGTFSPIIEVLLTNEATGQLEFAHYQVVNCSLDQFYKAANRSPVKLVAAIVFIGAIVVLGCWASISDNMEKDRREMEREYREERIMCYVEKQLSCSSISETSDDHK